MKSQCISILNHMKNHGTLTPLEAWTLYGCYRCGARIWDLKNAGHNIETKMIEVNGKKFAQYSLAQKQMTFF